VATFAFLSETGVFRAFSAALFLPTSGWKMLHRYIW
jgi:hypothetical protein